MRSDDLRARLLASFEAGSIAIVLNTMALKAADLVPLATARGGLLRLLVPWFSGSFDAAGIARAWHSICGPPPFDPIFQTGFHLVVGVGMAIFFSLVLEPTLRGPPWSKGLLYGLVVWLANAFAVLPATEEGFVGSAHLTPAGMLWFASAHMLFFVALGVLFAFFLERRRTPVAA